MWVRMNEWEKERVMGMSEGKIMREREREIDECVSVVLIQPRSNFSSL